MAIVTGPWRVEAALVDGGAEGGSGVRADGGVGRSGQGGGAEEGRLVAGRYLLLERVGSGGMGTVWRASDEVLGRHVALKKLHVPPHLSDDERETLYERTRREARSAARITHPGVVVVHDVVDDGGLPCIVMEYVPSRTLAQVLREDGPLSPRETARTGHRMVVALRAAHAAGVLHRDVKPANVLLGEAGRVVLTDFGIAVSSDTSTLTRTGELVGSVGYLAPERVKGRTPGPASDLWSLGATLYEALEGAAPFRRNSAMETVYAIAADPLVPPRHAGPLAPLIEALLRKDPEERPDAATVEELLREGTATAVQERAVGRAGRTGSTGQVGHTGYAGPTEYAGHAGHAEDSRGRAVSPDHTPTHRRDRSGHTELDDGQRQLGAPGSGSRKPAPGRSRRRVAVWAAVAAVVLAGAGATALTLRGSGEGSGASDRPGASAPAESAPQEPGEGSGKPSGTAGPSPSDGASTPAKPPPAGYHLAEEKDIGLSVPVPDGWRRKTLEDGAIAFIDPAGLVRLQVSALDFASTDPLQHWKDDEAKSVREGKLPGYRQLRMQSTSYLERPAAVWEFTFEGKARQFRAIDLGFGRPGEKEYALYLSAPSSDWARYRKVFDTASAGLRLADEKPGG
ncbi:serine/threonine-protein kinase [Streptomyces sp. SCSIO ZS0520]|uniref:serine/threonine-protein kinase n=1 Tax=Streptomyces sp. SCSIO ZS0520 TaxID=2892996 RepID=UPI002954AE9F|nr:protein kinase [Streptomyces sp. SCSIO ZS0520]